MPCPTSHIHLEKERQQPLVSGGLEQGRVSIWVRRELRPLLLLSPVCTLLCIASISCPSFPSVLDLVLNGMKTPENWEPFSNPSCLVVCILMQVALDSSLLILLFSFCHRWAVSSVMTRQNQIPTEDGSRVTLALIPLWDMCNHTNGLVKIFSGVWVWRLLSFWVDVLLGFCFPLPTPTRRTSRSKPCCFLSPCSRNCVSSSYWKPRMPVLRHFEKLQRLHCVFKDHSPGSHIHFLVLLDRRLNKPLSFLILLQVWVYWRKLFIFLTFSLIALFPPSADSFTPCPILFLAFFDYLLCSGAHVCEGGLCVRFWAQAQGWESEDRKHLPVADSVKEEGRSCSSTFLDSRQCGAEAFSVLRTSWSSQVGG